MQAVERIWRAQAQPWLRMGVPSELLKTDRDITSNFQFSFN